MLLPNIYVQKLFTKSDMQRNIRKVVQMWHRSKWLRELYMSETISFPRLVM
jgi:hypothetical protein